MSVLASSQVAEVPNLESVQEACQRAGLLCYQRRVVTRSYGWAEGLVVSQSGGRALLSYYEDNGQVYATYDSDYEKEAQQVQNVVKVWARCLQDQRQLEASGYSVSFSVDEWQNPSLEVDVKEVSF